MTACVGRCNDMKTKYLCLFIYDYKISIYKLKNIYKFIIYICIDYGWYGRGTNLRIFCEHILYTYVYRYECIYTMYIVHISMLAIVYTYMYIYIYKYITGGSQNCVFRFIYLQISGKKSFIVLRCSQ